MKVVSVNVGKPKSYTLDGVTIETSMVRHSVSEINITKERVLGDEFSSPNFHGTIDAVVYALSVDRYTEWESFLAKSYPIGFLGENLSIDRLREEDFYLGDEYQVGTAVLRVTGPRWPCNKLNFTSGDKRMQKEFEERAWPGVYFEVKQEGIAKPGDDLKLLQRYQDKVTVLDLFKAIRAKKRNQIDLNKSQMLLDCKFLIEKYRKRII